MLTEEKALDMLDKLAEETNDAILRINCISDEVIKFYKNNKCLII